LRRTNMRYLLSIILCLWASCSWAFPPGFIGAVTQGTSGTADYCTSSDCSECTIQERFECGSTAGDDDSDQENSITYSSAGANTNDAYTATIITGSEGLYLTAGATATTPIFAGTDGDQYAAAIIKPLEYTETSSSNMFSFNDSGGLQKIRLVLLYAAGPIIDMTQLTINGIADTVLTDITSPTNARYWKIQYNNSTGAADGICKIWYSSDGQNWTLRHNVTNHEYTGQLRYMRVGASANDDYLFKDIRVSTSDINY